MAWHVAHMAVSIETTEDFVRFPMSAVRFPIELRPPPGFVIDDPKTWPRVEGRLEFVAGRLLYRPPCGDMQQDVVPAVAAVLIGWVRTHREFVVGSNEAGMKIG